MTGNTTFFGVRRGVGPPRHPSRLHCAGSALPKMPNRRRFGLQEGAIRRMPEKLRSLMIGSLYPGLKVLPSELYMG